MKVTHNIPDVRKAIRELRRTGLSIGFVPTMGALHDGHVSLIQKAKELSDIVIVSIFVNPTQFGPNEDYHSYPRPLEQDLAICDSHGVDHVFNPEAEEIYNDDNLISIKAGIQSSILCGESRPGHFDGVLQIVNKLFNIIKPDFAVFGQKDIQQFYIIRQMVKEFNMDIELVMAPTQRHPDGLAISSRNQYLNEEQRNLAPMLFQSLHTLSNAIKNGVTNLQDIIIEQKNKLDNLGLKTDYIECIEPPMLQKSSKIKSGHTYIIAGAVFAGQTRLIDNLIIHT